LVQAEVWALDEAVGAECAAGAEWVAVAASAQVRLTNAFAHLAAEKFLTLQVSPAAV
jgi:hypothetical protein